MSLIVATGFVNMGSMKYNAEFHRGGFFDFEAQRGHYVILRNPTDLEEHIQRAMKKLRQDDAIVPEGYFENLENIMSEEFAKYDEAFFYTNQLVLAIVDQGSGSVTYEMDRVGLRGGVLTIMVRRKSPMIQTMDFVTTTIHLTLDATYEITTVHIELVDQTF